MHTCCEGVLAGVLAVVHVQLRPLAARGIIAGVQDRLSLRHAAAVLCYAQGGKEDRLCSSCRCCFLHREAQHDHAGCQSLEARPSCRKGLGLGNRCCVVGGSSPQGKDAGGKEARSRVPLLLLLLFWMVCWVSGRVTGWAE